MNANDEIYCRLCNDTGRVRGLNEDLLPTINPCVLCYPEKLGLDDETVKLVKTTLSLR